jgi:Zn-dependent alcohol dehydrogenase
MTAAVFHGPNQPRRGRLEDVNDAFRAMKAGEVARTVLMFE